MSGASVFWAAADCSARKEPTRKVAPSIGPFVIGAIASAMV